MNAEGKLESYLPKELEKPLEEIEQKLVDKFDPARLHFIKARKFIRGTYKDPENSIKEFISAIESVCRTIYGNTSTLGKALNQMKPEGVFPPRLIAVIEAFYAYANDEPAVRHGGPKESRVSILDAELALFLSAAFIRYILEMKREK